MDFILSEIEVRILGSLIEKEKTTPEYYPLSLNSLRNACNQKSNRHPVTNYEELEVDLALERLREMKFAVRRTGDDMRVPKYRQTFTEAMGFNDEETAVITVLMLRGAQTPGEIKGRTGRLFEFKSLEDVDRVLNSLAGREVPVIAQLPKQHGKKENRYMHLFSGAPEDAASAPADEHERDNEINELREEINSLRIEIEQLRNEVSGLKSLIE